MMEQNSPLPPEPKPGKLSRLLSAARLKSEIKAVAERFPVTLVFIGLGTLFALTCVWDANWPDRVIAAASISLSLGTLMSLAAYLWCEYLHAERRTLLWQSLTIAIAFIDFVYLYFQADFLGMADGVGYGAAYTALVVAIFFLPIFRRSSIKLQWLYSVSVLGAVALAVVLQIVLSAFVAIVFGSIELLFGVSSWKVSFSVGILLAGVLPIVAGLCHLPRRADIEELTERDELRPSPLSAFTKNVLLPLALVYTAILYVYGLKILFTFTLPNGYVCWMITGIVTVVLVIVYGLQGYACSATTKPGAKRIAALALRWLPASLLPLLVLMSIAIFYRINEYGVTPSRLYMATFNIWAYLAAGYLIMAKLPKLNLVATSFALVFLLTSVIPHFNYCTWGICAVQNKVTASLKEAGAEKFPITYGQLLGMVAKMTPEQAESVASDIDWLDDWNNHSAIEGIVKSNTRITRWEILDAAKKAADEFDVSKSAKGFCPILQGFDYVNYKNKYSYVVFASESGLYSFGLSDDCAVEVPVDSLSALPDSVLFEPVRLSIADRPDDVFVLTEYQLYGDRRDEKPYHYISIRGYHFTNNPKQQ